MKLNTDESSCGNLALASARGILRDYTGAWISGFSRNLGVSTSVAAEIWGLRDELKIAKNLNFLKVF